MRTTTSVWSGLLVGLALLFPRPAAAPAQQRDQDTAEPLAALNVDFPGGTLQEYVDAIRKARPKDAANIIVMPDAAPLKVPPIHLIAVTVRVAMQVLEGPYDLGNGAKAEVNVASYLYVIEDTADANMVLKVMAEFDRPDVRSSVWSVEPALSAGLPAEELVGAVEAVLSLFPQKVEFSFHPPTGLLVARGTEEQLDLVNQTIERLIDSAERRQQNVSMRRNELEMLEQQQQRSVANQRVEEQELELAKTRLESIQKARELGNKPPDAVAEARLDVTRAETELVLQQGQRERRQRRIESLRESLEKAQQPRP